MKRFQKIAVSFIAVFLIVSSSLATGWQVRHWRSSRTLYEYALQLNNDNYVAHINLGIVLDLDKEHRKAIEHYTKALSIDSDNPKAYYNLAKALSGMGKKDDAVTYYNEALRLKSDYAEAHNNLGILLAARGEREKAIEHYNEALRLKSVETSRSVSELINDAVRDELSEDADDLATFKARVKEPTIPFEVFVKGLKRDGKI